MCAYAIVKFIDHDDCCAAVPEIWVESIGDSVNTTGSVSTLRYPEKYSSSKLKESIKTCEEPHESWKEYRIKVLYYVGKRI